jgi:secreted trypsin-like serine protease
MIVRVIIALAALAALYAPATAIVGGARNAGAVGNHIVMIVGARGNRGTLCTGTALARDLVLTAAHCVAPEARYQVMASNAAPFTPIAAIALHPRYDAQSYARGRVTADVALIKLALPLPGNIAPAALAVGGHAVAPGDRFVIAGFGLTTPGNDAGSGVARSATLIATGQPGNLQIRLVDPDTRGARAGLGACTGDSGGPAFRVAGGALAVIGVVSWSTGPAEGEGCGGMTGITPLTLYRAWIVQQAAKFGSPL